jgi:hypothetical protein
MDNENSKRLECPVCMNHYDLQEHQPRILPSCGHSLCENCITSLVGRAPSEINDLELSFESDHSPETISCPICKSKTTTRRSGIYKTLPINYALKDSLDFLSKCKRENKKCIEHEMQMNIFCFDKKCQHERINCFKCIMESHKNCNSDLMVDLGSIQSRVEVNSYTVDREEFMKRVDRLKIKLIQDFTLIIDEVFENIQIEVLKKYVKIDLSDYATLADGWEKIEMRTLSQSKNQNMISLSPKNKQDMDRILDMSVIADQFVDILNNCLVYKINDISKIIIEPIKKQSSQYTMSAPRYPFQSSGKVFKHEEPRHTSHKYLNESCIFPTTDLHSSFTGGRGMQSEKRNSLLRAPDGSGVATHKTGRILFNAN